MKGHVLNLVTNSSTLKNSAGGYYMLRMVFHPWHSFFSLLSCSLPLAFLGAVWKLRKVAQLRRNGIFWGNQSPSKHLILLPSGNDIMWEREIHYFSMHPNASFLIQRVRVYSCAYHRTKLKKALSKVLAFKAHLRCSSKHLNVYRPWEGKHRTSLQFRLAVYVCTTV